MRSLRDDPQAVAAVLRACRPDVVCLQEAPRFWRWQARRRALAREAGLVLVTGLRSGGVAVLTRPGITVTAATSWLLPRTPWLHRRAVAVAVVEMPGWHSADAGPAPQLAVASLHLGLSAEERERHARLVLERTAALHPGPWVLAGDINEEPGRPAFALLAGALPDAAGMPAPLTFPSSDPRRRIDAVFADRRLPAIPRGIPYGAVTAHLLRRATDHLPVLADIGIPVDFSATSARS